MSRNLVTVEKEITATREQLKAVKGKQTEVYARIVGYYRSVRNWNKGKREEFDQRKLFVFDTAPASCACDTGYKAVQATIQTEQSIMHADKTGSVVRYELYARSTCPNCPPVKAYLAEAPIAGDIIDVDSEAGFAKASELGIFSAPTVIFYNEHSEEVFRAHSVYDMQQMNALYAIA